MLNAHFEVYNSKSITVKQQHSLVFLEQAQRTGQKPIHVLFKTKMCRILNPSYNYSK